MKITKQMREDAATLCSAAACNPYADLVFESFAAGYDVVTLACNAFEAAPDYGGDYTNNELRLEWAEAEAMLRTGWSPS